MIVTEPFAKTYTTLLLNDTKAGFNLSPEVSSDSQKMKDWSGTWTWFPINQNILKSHHELAIMKTRKMPFSLMKTGEVVPGHRKSLFADAPDLLCIQSLVYRWHMHN